MSNDVTVKLKGDKSALDRELKASESNVKDYAGAIKGLLIGIGSAIAVKKLADFGGSMIELYNTQIQAETKLASVIRATGGAAGYTIDEFKAMASELQELTGIGDEVILSAQAIIATFKNIKGDAFREATVLAADMSAVLGTGLTENAKKVGKALEDPTKGMTALAEAGVVFSKQQQDVIKALQESGDLASAQKIIIDELSNTFGGAAADQANTFAGQVTKLWNRIGDLGEVIGGLLVPVLQSILPIVDKVVTVFSGLGSALAESTGSVETWSESWSSYFSSTFETVLGYAVDAFSTLEFLYTNWSNIWERTTYSWMLSTVSAFEDLKQLFTVTAPAYIEWFFDNWQNLLVDYANFQLTVYSNMWKNITEFFEGVQSWLTGGKGGFEFVALTEGFESTLSELPKIAARQQSDTEKYLANSINQLDEMMGDSFSRIHQKNKDFIDDLFDKPVKAEVDVEPPNLDALKDVSKEIKKSGETVKADAKAALQTEREIQQERTRAGEITGLASLAEDIQKAASETRDVKVDIPQAVQQQPQRPVTQEDAVIDALAALKPNNESKEASILSVLETIRDFYPQLINQLKTVGGVV